MQRKEGYATRAVRWCGGCDIMMVHALPGRGKRPYLPLFRWHYLVLKRTVSSTLPGIQYKIVKH